MKFTETSRCSICGYVCLLMYQTKNDSKVVCNVCKYNKEE